MNTHTRQSSSWKTLLALGVLAVAMLLGRNLQTTLLSTDATWAQIGFPQSTLMRPTPPSPPTPPSGFGVPGGATPNARVITEDIRSIAPDPNHPGAQRVEVRTITMAAPGPAPRDDAATREIEKLLRELRSADAAERDPAQLDELRKLIGEQFQKRHDDQVARLKKVLADAQQTQQILEQRSAQRAEIINRRVEELLGKKDTMSWDYQVQSNDLERSGVTMTPFGPIIHPQISLTSDQLARIQPPTPPQPPSAPTPAPGILREHTEALERAQQTQQKAQADARHMHNKLVEEVEIKRLGEKSRDVADSQPSDIISLAFRIRSLREQVAIAEAKHDPRAIFYEALSKLKNELAATEAAWHHQQRALSRKLELQLLELDDLELERKILEAELQSAGDRLARGDKTAAVVEAQAKHKIQQARNAVTRKKIELEALRQELEWAKDFAKQLENQEQAKAALGTRQEETETQRKERQKNAAGDERGEQSEQAAPDEETADEETSDELESDKS